MVKGHLSVQFVKNYINWLVFVRMTYERSKLNEI